MPSEFVPGDLVRHPDQPEWGTGQVQSVIDDRITVNFEHAGKRLINGKVIRLMAAPAPKGRAATPEGPAPTRPRHQRHG